MRERKRRNDESLVQLLHQQTCKKNSETCKQLNSDCYVHFHLSNNSFFILIISQTDRQTDRHHLSEFLGLNLPRSRCIAVLKSNIFLVNAGFWLRFSRALVCTFTAVVNIIQHILRHSKRKDELMNPASVRLLPNIYQMLVRSGDRCTRGKYI